MFAFLGLMVAGLFMALLGLDVPGGVEDIAVTLVTGLLLVFLSFVLLWASAMLVVTHKWAKKKLNTVDAALAPFGRTGTGQYLHGLSVQLQSAVDEPNDPLIIKLADLLYKTLPETEQMISREQMSEAALTVTSGISQLLDGVEQKSTGEVPSQVVTSGVRG